ncbi:MAG: isoprenylcysteine carboxylmethyltransferase family protein [Terriglobales bacterium]
MGAIRINRVYDWSDWAGFAVFTLLWVGVVSTTPALGIMTAPLVLHPILSSAGFLLRKPLVSVAPGILPRLAGYLGTFGVMACFAGFQTWYPSWMAPASNAHLRNAGTCIWALGAVFDVWAVWSLRHGMSIIPQARTLITTGAYRYVRHPLYAAYILQNIGLSLRYPSFAVFSVVLGWFLLALLRVRYEEAVLTRNFPDYSTYRRHVGMFFPRLQKQKPLTADEQLTAAEDRLAEC